MREYARGETFILTFIIYFRTYGLIRYSGVVLYSTTLLIIGSVESGEWRKEKSMEKSKVEKMV